MYPPTSLDVLLFNQKLRFHSHAPSQSVISGGCEVAKTGFQRANAEPDSVVIPSVGQTAIPVSVEKSQTKNFQNERRTRVSEMVTPWNCQLLSFLLLIGKSRLAPQREARVQIQASGRCIDFSDAGFHCVPIFQCSNEGVIKTDAGGLFDPRYTC